jgi:hypothetical protein
MWLVGFVFSGTAFCTYAVASDRKGNGFNGQGGVARGGANSTQLTCGSEPRGGTAEHERRLFSARHPNCAGARRTARIARGDHNAAATI